MLTRMLYAGPVAGPGESHQKLVATPPGFAMELLPEGTTVHLAASSATYDTVVGVSPSFTLFGIPAHLVALNKAGWLGGAFVRGFTGGTAGAHLRPVELCRNGESATVEFAPLHSGGFAIRAGYVRKSKAPCADAATLSRLSPDVAIPILEPAGVMTRASFSQGGLDDVRSEMRGLAIVRREVIASELAVQLALGGWTVTRQASVDNVSVIRGRNTSAAGDPISALVSVTEIVGTPFVDLWLRVTRHKPAT